MNRTTKNIILIAVFAASVVGAFVLTKRIKANNMDNQKQVPDSIVVEDTTKQVSEDIVNKDTILIPTQAIEEPVEQTISKMSAGEFQRLLINGNVDYRKNKRIAKFVSLRTRGLHEGDRPLDDGDMMAVNQKIINDQWKSIRVISVGYDDKNRINSVVIEPIYFEDQPSEVQSAQNQSDNQE